MPTPAVIPPPHSSVHLKKGFDELADLLALTLGPTQGIIINDSTTSKRPELFDDAATVARRIVALPDRRQDVGAMLLRQVVWRMHQQVGDGAATTAVLAQAILHEATRMVTAGAKTVLVQDGIEKAVAAATKALHEMAQPVSGQEDLAAVAQAVTSQPDIAWVLGEMFSLLGEQAHITIENYVAPFLERIYIEGGRWDAQLISPYLVTAQAGKRAIQKDCQVVLFDSQLKKAEDLKPLLDLAASQSPPNLLLVAPEISGDAVNMLVGVHAHPKNKMKIVAASLSLGGDQGRQELNDLALLTGATLLGEIMGRPLSKITAADLGQAKRVEADKEDLFVILGSGEGRAIREQIQTFQAQIDRMEPGDETRQKLQIRLARLSGSAGILKIGAQTKPERTVLRQKAEQGIKALAAALAEGIVPGGGVAYAQAALAVDPDTAVNPDERMGMLAVKEALKAPFFRILENSHIRAPALPLHDILETGGDSIFDIVSGEIRDAKEAGVMDAAQTVRMALEMAASGAKMALSVDVTVLKRRPVTNVNYEP